MKKNALDFSIYSSSQIVMVLISIVTSSIWARYATQEQFGAYQLFMSFIVLVGIFNLPGLGMSMQLSSAKNKNNNLDRAMSLKIKYSLLSSIILLILSFYYYFYKNNALLSFFLLIGSLLYPTYNFNTLWENWLTGIRKVKKLSLLLILNSLILLVSVSLGLIILENIYISILSIFIFSSILNILVLKFFTKDNNTNESDDTLIKYGFSFSGAVIISMMATLDKFIISELISLSEVAIYGVAMTFVLQIKILYTSINKIIAPTILKARNIKEAWFYLRKKLFFIWLFFSLVGIIGFLFIEDLIVLIFTEKYIESTIYAKWLWLITSLFRPVLYISSILKAQKKLKFAYYIESINSFMKIGLFLILLPIMGLWGVVYAVLITNVVALIFILYYFYKEYRKEEVENVQVI